MYKNRRLVQIFWMKVLRRYNAKNSSHATHLRTEQPADHLISQYETDWMQQHAMNFFLQLPRQSLIFKITKDEFFAATTLVGKPKMSH
jgi:hypothetical protein